MKDFSYILAIRLMQQEFEGFADYFLASYIKLHTRIIIIIIIIATVQISKRVCGTDTYTITYSYVK